MAFLDETGLAELWSLIQAEDEKLAAADVKIETGTYTGTGQYSRSLTFGFVPKLVRVEVQAGSNYGFTAINGMTQAHGNSSDTSSYANIPLTWSGTTLSWSNSNDTYRAMNGSGTTYYYFAIG